jgi:hypothetical protein
MRSGLLKILSLKCGGLTELDTYKLLVNHNECLLTEINRNLLPSSFIWDLKLVIFFIQSLTSRFVPKKFTGGHQQRVYAFVKVFLPFSCC